MRIAAIRRTLGALLLVFSNAFLVAIVAALIYGEWTVLSFSICWVVTIVFGGLCFIGRKPDKYLRSRDAFFVVTLCYVAMGFVGALPFWLIPAVAPTFADALFESISGITTTGATVLAGLDYLPKSVLLYRQLLQWIGGMGIIVLAIAILPTLGVGGMQLYKAEAPGSERDLSLHMRAKDTAGSLWTIYLGLTIACGVAYWIAGMPTFDAICHALSTVAIGGFSTHDRSIGYFDSVGIESVAIVFMVLSGINFMVHYIALHPKRNLSPIKNFVRAYYSDSEVRLYLSVLFLVVAIVSFKLVSVNGFSTETLRDSLFQAVSFATTTGFTTTDYDGWPLVCPIILLFASFIGGCTGSTAGGIKVYRILLLVKQGVREIRRFIHPGAVFNVRVENRIVEDRVLETVWGFLAVYAACFMSVLLLVLVFGDLDFKSAFSAVTSAMNNLGPGLGEVSNNYFSLSAADKYLLSFAMVLGRLEIFTVLVLFAPRYWKR